MACHGKQEELWPFRSRECSFYTSPQYLNRVKEARPLDVVVIEYSDGDFMAFAPEWMNASGYGDTEEEALDKLMAMLEYQKEVSVEDENVTNLRRIPVKPSMNMARM